MPKPVRYIGTPTGTQLPALPSAAEATMVAPAFSASEFVDNLTAGLGMALGDRVEGVGQMVAHPVNTAREFANTLMTVARNPRRAGNALLDAAVSGAKRASSGPLGFGEVAGQFLPMPKAPSVLRNELIVHHGTPHRFPATDANPLGEFDASKIDTGEGAQAYGHGVYLAENPKIASGYRKDLSNYTQPFVQFKGQKIAGTSLSDLDIAAYKYLQKGQKDAGQFPHNTVYYAKKAVENAPDKYWSEKFSKEEILNRINEYGSDVKFGEEKNLGTLYKADLPDEMIARMLDWDKPMSEQPAAVREALKRRITSVEPADKFDMGGNSLLRDNRLGQYDKTRVDPWILEASGANGTSAFGLSQKDVDRIFGSKDVANLTGEQIISRLAQQQGSQAAASKYLADLGIPGIKYLDAGSRGQGGSGTRNFVVFPGEEKKVRILERK